MQSAELESLLTEQQLPSEMQLPLQAAEKLVDLRVALEIHKIEAHRKYVIPESRPESTVCMLFRGAALRTRLRLARMNFYAVRNSAVINEFGYEHDDGSRLTSFEVSKQIVDKYGRSSNTLQTP